MADNEMQVVIGARISRFTRAMRSVRRSVDKVQDKIGEFQQKMGKIANVMRSFGTVAGSAISGGLISVLPALAPIIASLVGGLGGLVTSFAAAGTGAAMFGVVAVSALKDVFSANSNIKKLRKELANTTDLKKRAELNEQIAQATADLSEEQQRGLKALQSFGKFWGKFAKQFEKPVMNVFVRSLEQLQGLLESLKPAFDGALKAVDGLSKSLGKGIKSDQFKSFVDFLNASVGPAMTALGKSFGNIMLGIFNLMTAFGPLSVDMQDGLVGLTKKFADWTAGLKDSKAFQKFIDYVKENGPKVMDLIGNITSFLVELGKGMAPLGSKILDMVNSFLSFSSALMKNHPLIAKIIAVVISLGGVLLALIPGIVLMQTVFSGMATIIAAKTILMQSKLVTGIAKMITSLGSFALKMVTTVASFVAQAAIFTAKMVATAAKFVAKWLWMGAQALIQAARVAAAWFIALGPVGWVIATVIALVALIIANWDSVKKWTVKIWNAVWGWIKDVASKIWSWVSDKFSGVFDVVKKYMKMAQDNIKRVWSFIKDSFSNALSFVKSLLKGDFKGMWNAVKDQMGNIKDTVSDIWGNITGFFEGIDLYQSGKKIIQSAIDGIGVMKDKVVNKVKGIAQSIRDFFPFSPAKTGPLKTIHKMDFGTSIAKSINNGKRVVTSAATNLAKAALPKIGKVDYGARMKASISKASTRVQSSINHMVNVPKLATEGVSGASDKEQYAIINIGGHEAKGIIDYFTDVQKREERQKSRARGEYN